ncbi:MAG: FtsH protease activity modulator HflK [Candidatus Krumholzibacteriia bacterium]
MSSPARSQFPIDRVPLTGLKRVVPVVLLLVLVFSAIFTVDPEEVAVVLRFGKYTRTADPGINMRIPLVERIYKVPIQRQLKQEFGFRTARAGVRTQYSSRSFLDESLMLTGDLNTVVVEWIVQYKIKDPVNYTFKVRNVEETFHDMGEAGMREVVGDHSVNEVLTVRRQEVEDQAKLALQGLCDQYEMGINVQVVVLQNVTPPDKVKPSFNEVNQAIQEKEKLINEALSDYNREIPRAEGEAKRTVEASEGYALQRVNRAQGDAARFLALFEEYRKAPEVTRRRLYLETMSAVLPRVGRKLVIDETQKGVLPLLNLQVGGEKP